MIDRRMFAGGAALFASLVLPSPGFSAPTCWHYHIAKIYPCRASAVTEGVAVCSGIPSAFAVKKDFPQYVCDYIASLEKSVDDQRLSEWNSFSERDQAENIKEAKNDFKIYQTALHKARALIDALNSAGKSSQSRLNAAWKAVEVAADSSQSFLWKDQSHGTPQVAYLNPKGKGLYYNTWDADVYLGAIRQLRERLQTANNDIQSKNYAKDRKRVQSIMGQLGAFTKETQSDHVSSLNAGVMPREGSLAHAQQEGQYQIPIRMDFPSPPPPNDIVTKRNYDSRGKLPGEWRKFQEMSVKLWHKIGMTRTVGRPNQKAELAFQQKDGTCGLSSLSELLRANGKQVSVQTVAQVAHAEIPDLQKINPGDPEDWGGTTPKDLKKLAGLFGFNSVSYLNVSPQVKRRYRPTSNQQLVDQKRLDEAIRDHHGAVVSVWAELLWKHGQSPSLPPIPPGKGDHKYNTADHDVYVTAEEVNSTTGRVAGYWINDTGTGEGGRFVKAENFLRAWRYGYDEMTYLVPK